MPQPLQIIEVSTAAHRQAFLRLPHALYKNDKNWVPHLQKDVAAVFDAQKNPAFAHGVCARWLAYSGGVCVGRIAAFVQHKKAYDNPQPTGGAGFFECINDQTIAFALFDTAKNYLNTQGMQAMEAPVNFGVNERFWGLLTHNFADPPVYLLNYNPEYYVAFFENYGFQTHFHQLSFRRTLADALPAHFHEKLQKIKQNPRYTVRQPTPKQLPEYALHFADVYNQAWTSHENFEPLTLPQIKNLLKKIKPIAEQKLTYFAFFDDTPVGFFILLPQLNEQFRFLGGKFGWFQKIFFALHRRFIGNTTAIGFVFGIVPQHQAQGVDALIFDAVAQILQTNHSRYKHIVVGWVGDFNLKMLKITQNMGAVHYRTHTTYRRLFDDTLPFTRRKAIDTAPQVFDQKKLTQND
jgi:hypothetical protein